MPDDVGMAFLAAAKAFQRVSSSSFGTLTATALMAAAKRTKGRSDIPWSEVPALVAAARDAMIERGKGALGDKSVLDVLDAVAVAIDRLDDPDAMLTAASGAADRVDYVTTKSALLGLTRAIAMETVGAGITCNAVAPGSVLTDAIDARVRAIVEREGVSREEAERKFLAGKQPTGRFISAKHVADLVVFLWRDKERGSDDQETDGEVVNLKLAKHRNGPTGEVQLWFKKRQTRFVSYAGERFAEVN